MKNKILIKLALWLLSKVNKDEIKYKNSWGHYLGEIENFLYDIKKPNGTLIKKIIKDKWISYSFTTKK